MHGSATNFVHDQPACKHVRHLTLQWVDKTMNYKNVLLIDDSDVDRYLLRRQVKKIKLAEFIHEAEHGKQALGVLEGMAEFSESSDAPLILVDINMPVMNGFEFLEAFAKLRNNGGALKNARVVMISSSDISDDKVRAASHDFVIGYITKSPESPESFKERLEELVA